MYTIVNIHVVSRGFVLKFDPVYLLKVFTKCVYDLIKRVMFPMYNRTR